MNLNIEQRKGMELGIKLLAVLAAVLFFVPIYSCSLNVLDSTGNMNISFSSLTFGINVNGYSMGEGQFGYIFVLLLPLTVLGLVLFAKNNLLKNGLSVILELADIIIFITVSGQNVNADFLGLFGLSFTSTTWLIIDYLVVGVMLVLSIVLLSTSKTISEDAKKVSATINNTAERATISINNATAKRVCAKCGAELTHNDVFCPKCGEKYILPEVVKCPSCGAVMSSDEVFCHKCGKKYEKPVDKICPSCGAKNGQDMLFCGKCGTKLVEQANFVEKPSAETQTTEPPVAKTNTEPEASKTIPSTDNSIEKDTIADNTVDEKIVETQSNSEPVVNAMDYVFCSKCGAKNDADAAFCQKCGSKIE